VKKKSSTESENEIPKKPREFVFLGSTQKDLAALPELIRDQFAVALTAVQHHQAPSMKLKHLHVSKEKVAIELIINGRPAYRLVYTTKTPGKVIVLFAGKKTAQGVDKTLMNTVEARLKEV
jgi:phage-related protein